MATIRVQIEGDGPRVPAEPRPAAEEFAFVADHATSETYDAAIRFLADERDAHAGRIREAASSVPAAPESTPAKRRRK